MITQKTIVKVLLSGNEALAHGAWEAGLAVACAYPGTPSTEILENLARFSEIDAQWSVNEKVAFEVALGAAIGGKRALFACKHVGLNVAMDPLMTASYTGISGGFVVVCDDPQMHSSQNEQDTRWIGIFAKLPILEPSGPAEARQYVKEAFDLSEQFDTPVLVRMTTRVSHTKEDVEIAERTEVEPRPFTRDIAKYVMIPRNARGRHLAVQERLTNLHAFADNTPLNREEQGSPDLGIITAGVAYNYVKECCPEASILKLGIAYPFCDEKILDFAARVKNLVVIEELDPFIEEHLKALGLKVKAKHRSFRVGELGVEFIPEILKGSPKNKTEAPARKPLLCPGCPHRHAFVVLKKLKVFVVGDIGCYSLASLPPLSSLHTCICMGTGVTLHEGLRRALPHERTVGVLGDSTFVHSGVTGLINAAYNNAKGVFIILDNSTTAMTGGQQHPATGLTIRNKSTRALDLAQLCRSCGAENVDVIDQKDIAAFEKLLRKRLDEHALTVVIARSPCRLIDRDRKPAPVYETAFCKQCGLCLDIDCPAVLKNDDGCAGIDAAVCVGCNLCVDICPFGALTANEQ